MRGWGLPSSGIGFRVVFPAVDGKEQVSLTTAEAIWLERREGRHCDPILTLLFQGSGLGDIDAAVLRRSPWHLKGFWTI